MTKQATEQSRIRLIPRPMDDDTIDRELRARKLQKVIVHPEREHLALTVLDYDHWLVYDQTSKPFWRYYEMPLVSSGWVMERDGTRVWCLVVGGQLAAFDLDNSEWLQFSHDVSYDKVLYAEKDTVIVQWSVMHAIIDVLRLQGDRLKRVASLPVVLPFDRPARITRIMFLPDENRFLALVNTDLSGGSYSEQDHVLLTLEWDGRTEIVLAAQGKSADLAFPFFVVLNSNGMEVMYADVREKPIKLKQLDLPIAADQSYPSKTSRKATFVFGEDLFVVLEWMHSRHGNRRLETVTALVELGEKVEVLRQCNNYCFWENRLGRFLIDNSGNAYDLVAKQELRYTSLSTILYQAIQDESKESNRRPFVAKPMLPLKGEIEDSSLSTFKCILHESPIHLTDIFPQKATFSSPISSSKGDLAAFMVGGWIGLFPRDRAYIQQVLPSPERGWMKFAFDEEGQIWLCDEDGEYICVVRYDDQKEGVGLALSHHGAENSRVDVLAVHANYVAMACKDSSLTIYHYTGESLEKRFSFNSWESRKMLMTAIKPDVSAEGWWITMYNKRSRNKNRKKVLEYLDLKTNCLETVTEVPEDLMVLGDWPERVYFVYPDDAGCLHYTLNPRDGWQQAKLQDALGDQSARRDNWRLVSLHSIDDEVLALFGNGSLPSTYLLVRLQSSGVELISAFRAGTMVQFARWSGWFLLYSNGPFTSVSEYAALAQHDELPENSGLLFYHPRTGQFSTEPYVPYASSKALYRALINRRLGSLPKFSL